MGRHKNPKTLSGIETQYASHWCWGKRHKNHKTLSGIETSTTITLIPALIMRCMTQKP